MPPKNHFPSGAGATVLTCHVLLKRIEGHDEEIMALFEAIRQLMEPPEKTSKRIGFHG